MSQMKRIRVQSKVKSFNQLNNTTNNNIDLQTETCLNKKGLKSRSTADIPTNVFSSKASDIKIDFQTLNNFKIASATSRKLEETKNSIPRNQVIASERIFMSKSIDREFKQIEFRAPKKKQRERGIQIPYTPQPNWEELRKASQLILEEDEDEEEEKGMDFEESSFFDSSTNSITEEDSEEDWSSGDDSSLSEGVLEKAGEVMQVKTENKCKSIEQEIQKTDFIEAIQDEVMTEKESDEAKGDICSVLSFLRVTGAKEIKVPLIKSKSRYSSFINFKAQKGNRSQSVEKIRKVDKKTKELTQICQICNERVYNSQDVACFFVCEHYLHEFCLLELIDHQKYQTLPLKNLNKKGQNEKNNSYLNEENLFCPKCHQF